MSEKPKPLIHGGPYLNLGSPERPIIVLEQEFAAMAKNPQPPCQCRACALTHGFETEPDPNYEARIQEFFKLYGITDTPEERARWAEGERNFQGILFTKTEHDMAAELSNAIGKRTAKRKKDG